MIKIDIVKRVADQLKLKDREALAVVDTIIDAFKETINEFGRMEVRNFGVFQVKTRKPRTGRNPRNKKEYPIHPRKVVTFKLGKELKDFSVLPVGKTARSRKAKTSAPAKSAALAKPQSAPAPKMSRPAPIIQQTSFLPLEGEVADLKEKTLE
ncbi:MAG: HU family DNA-binding protein [bacterium]|nr:HU family DNA-binding protein [bacterium]